MRRLTTLATLLILVAAPAGAQSGSFGNAVVISGSEMLVAEPNTTFREGSVYVFSKGDDGWRMTDRMTAPEMQRADGFGTVLAVNDETLFVGQRLGPVHLFTRGADGWTPTGTLDGEGTEGVDPQCGQYGYCGTDFGIALATDGDWLLIGAPGAAAPARRGRNAPPVEKHPGAVHAYHRTGGTWTHAQTFMSSGSEEGDRFGATIHLKDGHALVGAPLESEGEAEGVGSVYAFRLENGSFTETGSLGFGGETQANFGASITVRGDVALVGAPGLADSRGSVFRFRLGNDGTWQADGAISLPAGESGDRFGTAVALSGQDAWVGAPTLRENLTGSTYVFGAWSDGRVPDTPHRLRLDPTVERDAFGGRIVATDNTVAVMAPGMHHRSGSVHVYDRTTDGWTDGQMLVSPPDALGAITGEVRECTDGKVGPFDCDEVELLSFVPNSILRAPENSRGVRTNDNWGWTDPETGREYALVGRNDGTSFIDITDPANPVLIGDLPKPWGTPPSQLWRDIKTYKDHAFIVADGAGDHGMQVFDLARLRTVQNPPELFEPDLHYTGIASSHNIIINEETGFAYTVDRQTCAGGLYMMNIENPLDPQFVGCSKDGDRGTHDSQCVIYQGPDSRYNGRELCLNSNGRVFAITDVTDKENPVTLASASSPDAGYIHQGWLTPDHKYFYQDDEADVIRGNVPTTRTLVWDLSNVEDPVLVTQFMGSLPASAHNLYLKDGFAYQANYRYGLHVLDIADPENPVEVGFFDTSPYQEGPGFSGAWSTYPFFESGTVIVTSLQEGLFVLRKKREAF